MEGVSVDLKNDDDAFVWHATVDGPVSSILFYQILIERFTF